MPFRALTGEALAERLTAALDAPVERWDADAVWVRPSHVGHVARFLRDDDGLDFQFLNAISAVDFIDCFDVVYHLTSFRRMHKAVVKARLHGRDSLSLPSVYAVWRGADLQEREVWDLMGIHFEGHPNMKRIMLWEGFDGHPLRKDYL